MVEIITGGALLDDSGKYRFSLWREWDPRKHEGTCVFIMLNPSTADAEIDDPTIRKCIGFAQRWGFSRMEVVNLFAYRTPNPKVLLALPQDLTPIGRENKIRVLDTVADENVGMIICSWGNDGKFMHQDKAMLEWLDDMKLHCLGTNKNGTPKHPLYVSYEVAPMPFGDE